MPAAAPRSAERALHAASRLLDVAMQLPPYRSAPRSPPSNDPNDSIKSMQRRNKPSYGWTLIRTQLTRRNVTQTSLMELACMHTCIHQHPEHLTPEHARNSSMACLFQHALLPGVSHSSRVGGLFSYSDEPCKRMTVYHHDVHVLHNGTNTVNATAAAMITKLVVFDGTVAT